MGYVGGGLRKGAAEDGRGEDWNIELREVTQREGSAFVFWRFSGHGRLTSGALTTETANMTKEWLHLKRNRENFSAGCGTYTVQSRRLYSILLEK